MRKRLLILTATVMSALGIAAGATAAIGSAPPHPGAPAGAGCPGADLTCTM